MASSLSRRRAGPVHPHVMRAGPKLESGKIDQQRRDERSADSEDDFLVTAADKSSAEDDRAPAATRLRVILGLSLLSWLVVGLVVIGIAALLRNF